MAKGVKKSLTCHWCPNEASAYQDWDNGWVSVCMPCHLKDCISPKMHGSEAKRTAIHRAAETTTRPTKPESSGRVPS